MAWTAEGAALIAVMSFPSLHLDYATFDFQKNLVVVVLVLVLVLGALKTRTPDAHTKQERPRVRGILSSAKLSNVQP